MKTERTKSVKAPRRTLRVTVDETYYPAARFWLNGKIPANGDIVEASESEAVSLIARGCAVDATEAEVTAAEGFIEVAPHREKTWVDA